MSIGGYLADCTKQPNLTVNNYTRMVGIGTSTPTSKLHVNGTVTASSFVKSGGDDTQYLMADGSTSSFQTGPLKIYTYEWDGIQKGVISHSNQLVFALNSSSLQPLPINICMTMDLLGVTIPKSLTASSFVKSGGDETQYLMADGSTSSFRTGPLKFYHYDWGTCKAE